MTPTYRSINSSSPPTFPFELNNISEDHHDLNHPLISPNYQDASSSFQYSSCQIFFNSTTTQDQTGYYHHTEYYQPQHQPEVVNYALGGGSYELEKTNKAEHGLKLSLWKKEDKYENENEKNPLKWMSSKMRLMQKMKNSDRASAKNTNSTILKLGDDQKQVLSSPDSSSNSSSNNSANTIPIRVCSDCNTTKTPLWRSGPKGPKSLCNACGIRQRKARRAMAAAAAANGGTTHAAETSSSSIKIKVQQKEKITKVSTNNQVRPYKKRCKFVTAHDHGSSSNSNSTAPNKKLGFEDVLINLSKNLAIHQVFPQDEKEAAILLMALSCGLVHS